MQLFGFQLFFWRLQGPKLKVVTFGALACAEGESAIWQCFGEAEQDLLRHWTNEVETPSKLAAIRRSSILRCNENGHEYLYIFHSIGGELLRAVLAH